MRDSVFELRVVLYVETPKSNRIQKLKRPYQRAL